MVAVSHLGSGRGTPPLEKPLSGTAPTTGRARRRRRSRSSERRRAFAVVVGPRLLLLGAVRVVAGAPQGDGAPDNNARVRAAHADDDLRRDNGARRCRH